MKGYVGDEQATRAMVDTEGWLRTGDLCYIDGQGFLFFVDRIKEIIKYKGYQVAPGELEHLLQSHPDVIDAAVTPYPDEEAGQIPMAFIVRQPGSTVDEPSIKAFVAKMVTPYKKIRRVMFIDSTPKNAAGKVLRRELSKLASLEGASKMRTRSSPTRSFPCFSFLQCRRVIWRPSFIYSYDKKLSDRSSLG